MYLVFVIVNYLAYIRSFSVNQITYTFIFFKNDMVKQKMYIYIPCFDLIRNIIITNKKLNRFCAAITLWSMGTTKKQKFTSMQKFQIDQPFYHWDVSQKKREINIKLLFEII